MISIKSARELERMRRAGRLVALVLDSLSSRVAPGMTTRELDLFAETEIRKLGAESAFLGYNGYPGNICISVNEEVVHGIGGKRRLREGDIVSIDVGVRYQGYFGDMAATFPVGKIAPENARLIETARAALRDGIAKARPGNRLFDISAAVQARAEGAGYSVVRDFVGHGIGVRLHEDPQVPNYGEPGTGIPLKVGMVLAIEPMLNAGGAEVEVLSDDWTVVTRDGRPSAHFEHTVALTEAGPEILTRIENEKA